MNKNDHNLQELWDVIKRTSLTIHEDGEGAEMQTKSIEKPIQ
jgi:hypothetical protein